MNKKLIYKTKIILSMLLTCIIFNGSAREHFNNIFENRNHQGDESPAEHECGSANNTKRVQFGDILINLVGNNFIIPKLETLPDSVDWQKYQNIPPHIRRLIQLYEKTFFEESLNDKNLKEYREKCNQLGKEILKNFEEYLNPNNSDKKNDLYDKNKDLQKEYSNAQTTLFNNFSDELKDLHNQLDGQFCSELDEDDKIFPELDDDFFSIFIIKRIHCFQIYDNMLSTKKDIETTVQNLSMSSKDLETLTPRNNPRVGQENMFFELCDLTENYKKVFPNDMASLTEKEILDKIKDDDPYLNELITDIQSYYKAVPFERDKLIQIYYQALKSIIVESDYDKYCEYLHQENLILNSLKSDNLIIEGAEMRKSILNGNLHEGFEEYKNIYDDFNDLNKKYCLEENFRDSYNALDSHYKNDPTLTHIIEDNPTLDIVRSAMLNDLMLYNNMLSSKKELRNYNKRFAGFSWSDTKYVYSKPLN